MLLYIFESLWPYFKLKILSYKSIKCLLYFCYISALYEAIIHNYAHPKANIDIDR